MKSIIITKWIEPYKLLETIKKDYKYKDFSFDTITKDVEKKKFLKGISNSKYSIGLFMKNVNKFYLFTRNSNFNILQELENDFAIKEKDYIISENNTQPFEMVDFGKAEASIIFN